MCCKRHAVLIYPLLCRVHSQWSRPVCCVEFRIRPRVVDPHVGLLLWCLDRIIIITIRLCILNVAINLSSSWQVLAGMQRPDGSVDPRWTAFMKFQIDRAQTFFVEAESGVDLLSDKARWPVWYVKLA